MKQLPRHSTHALVHAGLTAALGLSFTSPLSAQTLLPGAFSTLQVGSGTHATGLNSTAMGEFDTASGSGFTSMGGGTSIA